jgi:hypothetical protein
MVAPHVVCAYPDGTASAYVCDRSDVAFYSHWLDLLNRVKVTEIIEDRYEETGIETRFYYVDQELLQTTWSYGEFGIRGRDHLVSQLVAELLRQMG